MTKSSLSLSILFIFINFNSTFCMNYQNLNFLSHRQIKSFNTQIKKGLKDKNVEQILCTYQKLKEIEEKNYELLSESDIDWLDEKIPLLENAAQKLKINLENLNKYIKLEEELNLTHPNERLEKISNTLDKLDQEIDEEKVLQEQTLYKNFEKLDEPEKYTVNNNDFFKEDYSDEIGKKIVDLVFED